MKISLLGQLGSVNAQKLKSQNKHHNALNNPIINEIPNKSMQELLGRSQVSFKGDISSNGPEIIYTQKRAMGMGQDERITYDKLTGTFRYVERYPNGTLKKFHEFDYVNKRELVKEFEKDGSGYVELTTDTEVDTTEYSEGNRIESRRIERVDGSSSIFDYDYAKDRIIVKNYAPNSKTPTVDVLDINTQQSLPTSDSRTITKSKFKKADGSLERRTYNLVTGYIYESKIYKDDILTSGYSRDALGTVSWDAQTDAYGIVHENFYDEFANVIKAVTVDHLSRRERVQEFDSMGLSSHILTEFDKHDKPQKITVFDVRTNNPAVITTYNKSETITEEYDAYSQVRTRRTVTKNSKPVSEIIYHADGDTPKIEDLYFPNGMRGKSRCIRLHSEYDRYGNEKTVEFYSQEGRFETHFYNSREHFLECRRQYNLVTGRFEDEIYDNQEFLIKRVKHNSNGTVNKEAYYYQNTNIPSLDVIYSPDGAVTKTFYTEQGVKRNTEYKSATGDYVVKEEFYPSGVSVRFRNTFYPDGSAESIEYDVNGNIINKTRTHATKSNYRQGTNNSYSNWNNATYRYSSYTPPRQEATVEEVIENISSKIFKKGFTTDEIPYEQWETFAKHIGLESADELLKMEHSTFKKLIKKIHPDTSGTTKDEEKETLTKIINVLFDIAKQKRKP